MNILGKFMNTPIDIHLVSWNRPRMTDLVIRTLHRNTKRDNFRLVVLDNGSDKETVSMLKNLHDNGYIDEMHLMESNGGLEAARHYLLNHALYISSGYFVCLDNDCLAPTMKDGRDWIDEMRELMQKYEDYAAISMRTQVMIGTGNIFEETDKNGDDLVDFPHPGGSFRIMDRLAVESANGWDRQADGRGAEERLICGKLRDLGYKTAFATNIGCLHLFGTRGDGGTDRWGYDKDMDPEDTGHSDIWHPVLQNGDDREEVSLYAGEELTERYFK